VFVILNCLAVMAKVGEGDPRYFDPVPKIHNKNNLRICYPLMHCKFASISHNLVALVDNI